jgi:hypothetical protein
LYYLHHDAALRERRDLPRSTRTIWHILVRHGRIWHTRPAQHEPMERPAPLSAWQIDFKDASSVPPEPDGKQGHVVEVLNTVDVGTSILLDAHVRADFTAATALQAIAHTLRTYGLPDQVTIDRDPRFVGSAAGRDFPSPLLRFWQCLGIIADVCPPQRPDKNAFVERYHRTYKYECLAVYRPATVEQVRQLTTTFTRHYNHERPNQALSCRNQPPRVAFPTLPPRPSLPSEVDPDRWLDTVHQQRFRRKIQHAGRVALNTESYYVGRERRGQYVVLQVDAPTGEIVVYHQHQVIKRLPLKGLYQRRLPFDDYVTLICKEAQAEWRRYANWHRVRRSGARNRRTAAM